MALINHRAREIHFKIVYYGPGLGGKTTNLRILHDRLPPERRGKMISIATDHERTLFFDFLPLDLGQVNGFSTRFHLYTVPGQVYYRLSRRAVLQGVDGVVFVADSHPAREQANRESLFDLAEHLGTLGLTPAQVARMPRVFQYNKRDLSGALPVERMHALLNPGGELEFEAVASDGRGVNDTLKAVCKLVLARLTTEPAIESNGPMPILVMRRPGRAQMAKMAADAEAAEAAANSRSESAAVAAGTMPRPTHGPATAGAAPSDRSAVTYVGTTPTGVAPAGVAQAARSAPASAAPAVAPAPLAPRSVFPPRPVIAPPRSMAPLPARVTSPSASWPMAPQPAAGVNLTAPLPAASRPAPTAASPAANLPPGARTAQSPPVPASTPALSRPAVPQRPQFKWPWPARVAARPGEAQAPPRMHPGAAPIPASPVAAARAQAAASATSTPVNSAPAPVGAAPVPASPPAAVWALASASPAPAPASPAPPIFAQPPASPMPQAGASRMMWGRPPRPAARRGGPLLPGSRPAPPMMAPRPVNFAPPVPANGGPPTSRTEWPSSDARPPSPENEST